MKDNFDLKKYIKDNKIIEKSNKYVAATLNEEEVKKETPKKEKIEENVDLKSKIKEMVLAELSEDIDLEEYGKPYEEDGLEEINTMADTSKLDAKIKKDPKLLNKVKAATEKAMKGDSTDLAMLMAMPMEEEITEDEVEENISEKKLGKKGKEFYKGIKKADSYMKEEVETDESEDNVEAEEEVEVVDAEDAPAETDTPTDTGGIMGNLEAAIEKARELGDEKLIDQIGNTITFYTRQYISK